MKKVVISMVVLLCALLPAQSASAHVLITDSTKTKGAILHIVPDDDPVAGQVATLYLDMQNQIAGPDTTVRLSIIDALGVATNITPKLDGSLVMAKYAFPEQGVYNLTFTVTSNGKTYIFSQAQRVSRGGTANVLQQPTYPWAEMLLLTSGVAFMLLAIMAFNRRKDIAEHSTF